MEEIKKIAIKYYRETVNIRLYGIKGFIYIFISIIIILTSFYIYYNYKYKFIAFPSILSSLFLWHLSKKEYNKNLIHKLTYYTHLESNNIFLQKAIFIDMLTCHISPSIFETLEKVNSLVEINNKNRSLIIDNTEYYFSKFIYDQDSKNRVNSLLIYLISLVGILTAVKTSNQDVIYALIDSFSFKIFIYYSFIILYFIIIGYFCIIMPLSFINTYILIPLLLLIKQETVLKKYFITQLSKYSFTKIQF